MDNYTYKLWEKLENDSVTNYIVHHINDCYSKLFLAKISGNDIMFVKEFNERIKSYHIEKQCLLIAAICSDLDMITLIIDKIICTKNIDTITDRFGQNSLLLACVHNKPAV